MAHICDCCGKELGGEYYEYGGQVCLDCLDWLTRADISPCLICGETHDTDGVRTTHRYCGCPVHLSCLQKKLIKKFGV